MLSRQTKRKMITKKINDQYNDHPAKNSPLTKPESFPMQLEEQIQQAHLREALVEAIEENQFLKQRVIELEALSAQAQSLVQQTESRCKEQLNRIKNKIFYGEANRKIRGRSM